MSMLCSVYRSPLQEGMYLYVPKNEPFAEVPESLLQRFGTPGHVLDLTLTPEQKLARADARQVLLSIRQQGYYLQLPPKQVAW
ncbi:MAG: YcgL domain-containing protein [Pseudomonadota bacterium]|nr:hypothetical protein [Pseudomonadales bacterium]MDY6921734.1 YcgL domain-containing protein [Pseudomonadota bacterium]